MERTVWARDSERRQVADKPTMRDAYTDCNADSYGNIHTDPDGCSYSLHATATSTATPTATPRHCTPSYMFTSSTGGTIVPGTTDIGNHGDDVGTLISLPFPVTLYGTTYTQATAGSNGHLTLGTAYNGFSITCSPFGNTAATDATGPYWGDQCTGACFNTPCTNWESSPLLLGRLLTESSTSSIEPTTTA